MMGLIVEKIEGYVPCQAVGTMDEHPFYFSAKEGEWHLTVVKKGFDVLDAVKPTEAAILYQSVGAENVSHYIPPDVAEQILAVEYIKFYTFLSDCLAAPEAVKGGEA